MKNILITGAAQGIGYHMVHQLLRGTQRLSMHL